MTYENTNRVFKGKQKVLNGFESKIFAIKATQGIELERLNPKKNASEVNNSSCASKNNTSESLLNEIRQIINYLSWAKEITKKVYNNIINLVKV